ncbi:MAG: hypothetical protein ACE5R6_16650 [Candidatus Heimdallarchaeota archaeon]
MAELYNLGAKVDSDFLGITGKETLVAEITSPVRSGFFSSGFSL